RWRLCCGLDRVARREHEEPRGRGVDRGARAGELGERSEELCRKRRVAEAEEAEYGGRIAAPRPRVRAGVVTEEDAQAARGNGAGDDGRGATRVRARDRFGRAP